MSTEWMEAGSSDPAELLRAELAGIEPSPAFAAGVRARIEAGSGARFGWPLALAGAAVAVVAVAVGTSWFQPRGAIARPPAPIVAQRAPAAIAAPPVVVPAPAVSAPAPTRAAAKTVAAPGTAATIPDGPFLEVITNQPEMLRRVWAGIEGGVARVGLPTDEFAEITVAPIVVDAIVVPKIGPPAGGGLIPGVRRVVVDESARGDQR